VLLRFDNKYAIPVVIREEIQQTKEDISKLNRKSPIYINLDVYLN